MQKIILIFINNFYYSCSYIVSTRWQEWTSWTPCHTADKNVEAKCWRSGRDPPKRNRSRSCTEIESGQPKICNTEVRECTDLPVCAFGRDFKIVLDNITE